MLDLRLDLSGHVRRESGEELHRLLEARDRDKLVADRGLGLLELHLDFSLDGRRLREELLRRGLLRGRGLRRLLLDVDLEGGVELRLERGLRGRGLHLGLQRGLDPRGTLDLREALVLKLHLRMNLRLDLRGGLELRPGTCELDPDLLVDLPLCCLGLDLLDLPEVLHLDLSADLGRHREGGRSRSLSRARHDCGHRKTL